MGMSIRLMLFTGMRMQELLALEPRHISADGSAILIEQAVKLEKGTVTVGGPKTQASHRVIPVPSNVQSCAVALRNTGKKYIWEVGKRDCPCNPSYFRKQFKAALSKMEGVRILTPHCCRHTYVSQMRAMEIQPFVLMSLTGHSNEKMVAHDTHVQEDARKAACERLAQAYPIQKLSCNVL